MFRCDRLLFLILILLGACTSKTLGDQILIDVEKVCGEDIPLVTKIMKFKQSEFRIQKALRWSDEQIWDMKNDRARQYGLKWVQLRFQKDKLQAVWFGPRTTLEQDLHKVGIDLNDLRDIDGDKLDSYTKGTYYLRDLNNKKLRVDHKRGPEVGTSITCFPAIRK